MSVDQSYLATKAILKVYLLYAWKMMETRALYISAWDAASTSLPNFLAAWSFHKTWKGQNEVSVVGTILYQIICAFEQLVWVTFVEDIVVANTDMTTACKRFTLQLLVRIKVKDQWIKPDRTCFEREGERYFFASTARTWPYGGCIKGSISLLL